jgi:hypothetical protein
MGGDAKGRGVSGRPASPGCRADVLEWVERLLGSRPEVTQGKMFGFPAFYTAGRLFACVYGDGIGLKLPQDLVRRLEGKPWITPFQPYGKPKMKEWIQIQHERADTFTRDSNLFLASIRFVGRNTRRSKTPAETKRLPKSS